MKEELKEINNLTDLIQMSKNPNKGSERGMKMLEESIERCGVGRGICVDKNGVLIAGEKTWAECVEKGMKVEVVDTEGDTLVVTRRKDLDSLNPNDEKCRQLVFADNRVGEVSYDLDKNIFIQDHVDGTDLGWLYSEKETSRIISEVESDFLKSQGEGEEIPVYAIAVLFDSADDKKEGLEKLKAMGYNCRDMEEN